MPTKSINMIVPDSSTLSIKMAETDDMGGTLREIVWQAQEQGRLTCGVQGCAQMLEIDPYNVMLCVLPTPSNGVSNMSLDIHHMLIEAFCREYDIRLVRVDSMTKMAEVVKGRPQSTDNGVKLTRSPSTDTSCLIMQYPEEGTSAEEETLAQYYKEAILNDYTQTCHIALPD